MPTFLIATRNQHKVSEIKAVLGDEFRFLTLNDFSEAPAVIEDSPTFAGNATKKALELARWLATQPVHLAKCQEKIAPPFYILADDSGLEVDAIQGGPGVHSARFASEHVAQGQNAPDAANNAKLLKLLRDVPAEKRTARFRCVIAVAPVYLNSHGGNQVCYADPQELEVQTFDGACEGHILNDPRGREGFGYDPLFVPAGLKETFAELGESAKNKLSHRGQALKKLKERLNRAAR